ncbi:single-stranded DNA-binding protein, mitochondrial isoform X2 [Aristolochia californica]|uniref:single-stranded DNA-binding protein, mitochondrial isoform X2 n=1 Tax=Aristolochia californica TaxID=171875 RepID=UPI0035DC7A6D
MASSFVSLSRRVSRSLFSLPRLSQNHLYFSTNYTPSDKLSDSEVDPEDPRPEADENSESHSRPLNFERPLENGLEQGVYKAILVGQVGQGPVQKRLKGGRLVTLFSVGTGGIRNNRRPLNDEDPKEYANRSSVQWHRVSVYPERLGELAMKHVKTGGILYLEGNLESKVFSDPITGLVRRIREVAIRRDGRLVFLGKENKDDQAGHPELRSVGYY